MRIEQLRHLTQIARLGSMRRTAEDAQISQATLSETMKNLEGELGVQLLSRSNRGAQLTEVGLAVLPLVEEMLELDQRLHDRIDTLGSALTGQLKLGTVNAGTCTVLPQVLPAFSQMHPGVKLQVDQGGSLQIAGLVRARELDLGIVVQSRSAGPRTQRDGIESIELIPGRMMVCLPPAHPLVEKEFVTIHDIADEPLVVFHHGYLMHEVVTEIFGGSPTNAVFRTNDTESARRMVAAGMGVTLLPDLCLVDEVSTDPARLRIRPFRGKASRLSLSLVRQSQRHVPAAVEALTEAFVAGGQQFSRSWAGAVS